MNTKKFAISVAAVFACIFALDFLVHGVLLAGYYSDTASLWRPHAEYKFGVMSISQLGLALIINFIYSRNVEGRGVSEGFRFGLYLGLLLLVLEFGKFSYMPVPFTLVGCWMAAALFKGLLTGVVAGMVYRPNLS